MNIQEVLQKLEKYKFNYESFGTIYEVYLATDKYMYNDNLAIIMYYFDKEYGCFEVFTMLSVNLEYYNAANNQAAIDINNSPGAINFIEDNKLGEIVDRVHQGFVTYPVVEFNSKAMKIFKETTRIFRDIGY